MNDSLYHNARYNCVQITVASMLKNCGCDTELLFSQAGLYYDSNSDLKQNYFLDPYYHHFVEHVHNVYGVSVVAEQFLDSRHLMQRVNELLRSGKSIGLFADAYFLDYCNLYKTTHYLHSFELSPCSTENSFEVCDHYYLHHELMSHDKLCRVVEESLNGLSLEYYTLYYISKQVSDSWTELSYVEALRNNCRVMRGDRCYIYADTEQYVGTLGLEAIAKSGEYIVHLLEQWPKDSPEMLVTHIYSSLKEVANSRHHFHVYLNKYGESQLADLYLRAHQSWMVYANLFMRATMYPEIEMTQRLQQRILSITDTEEQIITHAEGILLS